MRVISQNGRIDIPYEDVIIQQSGRWIYFLNKNLTGNEDLTSDIEIAEYFTEEKAEKAMKLMHKAYSEFEVMKAIMPGCADRIIRGYKTESEIFNDYLKRFNTFRFPGDCEIDLIESEEDNNERCNDD